MGEGCPSEGQVRVKLWPRVAVIGMVGLGMLIDGASVKDGRKRNSDFHTINLRVFCKQFLSILELYL